MSLADKLRSIAEASAAKMPAETREIMHRNTEALAASGAADAVVGVGGVAPGFSLAGPEGDVSLASLLENGPVVLTWFRGNW